MKQPKVTVLMRAFNAEKYIAKAIESVLNQRERDFEFFVRNNGSSDKTGDIIKSYAIKDDRIVVLENKVNWILDEGENNWWPVFNGEYITYLDADDYLDERFIEVMYKASREHDADLTVCGTTMFYDENQDQKFLRIPPQIATKDMKDLESVFINLYGTLRTIWGKLYKTEFYNKNYEFAHNAPIHASSLDTYSVLGYMQKCRSFVSVNESLHYYCIHDTSSSRPQVVKLTCIDEAGVLFNRGVECLKALGIFSQKNSDALYLVHKNHINDLMNQVLKSQIMNVKEKVTYYQAILNDSLFSLYSLAPEVKKETLKLFMKHIEIAVINELDLIITGKDSYLSRLYLCYREIRNNEVNLLTLPRLLSAICDSSNKYLIDDELLALQWQSNSYNIINFLKLSFEDKLTILKDKNKLKQIFAENNNQEDFIIKKEKLDALILENQLEEALDVLNEISLNYPLSKDCLVYRIYLSFQFGDIEFAVDACNIALFFWGDSEEVLAISQDLFNEVKR